MCSDEELNLNDITMENQEYLDIEKLIKKYGIVKPTNKCTLVTYYMGEFGHVIIREIDNLNARDDFDDTNEYNYVDFDVNSYKVMLFTDNSIVDPCDRHGSLYVGLSFNMMKYNFIPNVSYRRFDATLTNQCKETSPIYPLSLNDQLNTIKFDVFVDNLNMFNFLIDLGKVVNKSLIPKGVTYVL